MKKRIAILMVLMIAVTFLAGCGKKESPAETAGKEAAKNMADLITAQQKIGQNYDPNDPASVAKVMDTYGQFGAQLELQEFEKAESVDAPSGFPSSLIYAKGKVTESSDSGDEGYMNKSVTIKTTDDVKTVKEFYKNLLSQAPWKITSQSSESSGASYNAKDAAGVEADVNISSNPYSKIVNISISYSGNITK